MSVIATMPPEVTSLLATFEAVAKLGVGAGFAALAWAFYTRRLRTATEFEEFKKTTVENAERIIADRDRTFKETLAERDARIRDLNEERVEFKKMVMGLQQATAKTVDAVSEAVVKRTR